MRPRIQSIPRNKPHVRVTCIGSIIRASLEFGAFLCQYRYVTCEIIFTEIIINYQASYPA